MHAEFPSIFTELLILSTPDEFSQLILESGSAEHVASNAASTQLDSSKETEWSESDVTTSSRCGTGRLSSFITVKGR